MKVKLTRLDKIMAAIETVYMICRYGFNESEKIMNEKLIQIKAANKKLRAMEKK